MNSNRKANEIAIKQFRKELQAMFDDISEIDIKCLNKAVNQGMGFAKSITPVGDYSSEVNFVTKDGELVSFTTGKFKQGGFMRKSWRSAPAVKSKNGDATKTLVNTADYSSHVNYGHRKVNKSKETVGFVKGKFILERAVSKINKILEQEFQKEVERVSREHDK